MKKGARRKPGKRRLTKRLIEWLAPPETGVTVVFDDQVKRLAIRVHPSGRRVFTLDYGDRLRRRRWTIGVYGSPWTVKKARDEAQDLLGKITKGRDPREERKLASKAGTFATWAEQYIKIGEAENRWTPRSLTGVRCHLERAKEHFGDRRLADVDAELNIRWRDSIHAKHGLTPANRGLSTVCKNSQT